MKVLLTVVIAILQIFSITIPLTGKLADNRKKIPKNLTKRGLCFVFINVFSIGLAIILFVITENESSQKDAKLISATDSLKASQRKIEENGIEIFKLTQKSDSFQRTAYLNSMGISQQIQESQKIALDKSEMLDKANKKIITLQDEFSKNVMGDGYATIKFTADPKNLFNLILKTSSMYSVNASCKMINLEKLEGCQISINNDIVVFKNSCFNESVFFDMGPVNYLGGVINNLGVSIPKKESKIITLLFGNRMKTVQYSAFVYYKENDSWVQFYRIYEISDDGKRHIKLLKASHPSVGDNFFSSNFPMFLKEIIIDHRL